MIKDASDMKWVVFTECAVKTIELMHFISVDLWNLRSLTCISFNLGQNYCIYCFEF